ETGLQLPLWVRCRCLTLLCVLHDALFIAKPRRIGPLEEAAVLSAIFQPSNESHSIARGWLIFGSFGFSAADFECEFDAEKATRRCDVIPTVIVPIRPHRQCGAGEELVRIFRPTFSASPLTTLAGAGE